MKKLIIFVLVFSAIISCAFSFPASASYDDAAKSLKLHSEHYILISLDNGTVIFQKNPDKQCAPASLTKIATAAVVLENCKDLTAVVTASEQAIDSLKGTGSSNAGIKVGETFTVDDLLHLLLIESANDAAMMLSEYVGGTTENFVKMMNELAEKLGCDNTSFVNPHGLDDEYQFTTPRDIVTIAQHALTFPLFKEIVGKTTYTVNATNMTGERHIINTNYLMNAAYADYYCQYASGVKTGSTSKAGKCVVSTASNKGYNYICAVMGAPLINIDSDPIEENCAFVDCKTMFDWVIKNLRYTKVAESGQIVAEVPVKLSRAADYVTLVPAEDHFEFIPTGNDAGSVLIEPIKSGLPASVNAPVKKGQKICEANILYAGKSIAKIDLVASNDVERSIVRTAFAVVKKITASPAVKAALAVAAALIILLIVLRIKAVAEKKRYESLHVISYNGYKK